MITPADKARAYFADTFAKHGASPLGLDWNGTESQMRRLAVLVDEIPNSPDISVNDIGCGYGSFLGLLHGRGQSGFTYTGYDLVRGMIDHANEKYKNQPGISFICGGTESLNPADYTVASGTFNMKQDVPAKDWDAYVKSCLTQMLGNTRKRMAVNFLTSYSDAEYMRDDLYYPDPKDMFDFGMRATGAAAIRHNYGLYDFTLTIDQI